MLCLTVRPWTDVCEEANISRAVCLGNGYCAHLAAVSITLAKTKQPEHADEQWDVELARVTMSF